MLSSREITKHCRRVVFAKKYNIQDFVYKLFHNPASTQQENQSLQGLPRSIKNKIFADFNTIGRLAVPPHAIGFGRRPKQGRNALPLNQVTIDAYALAGWARLQLANND